MRLSVYLDERNITHGDMARLIGTSAEAVRRYANGLRLPRPEIMGRIIAATDGAVEHADFYSELTNTEAA